MWIFESLGSDDMAVINDDDAKTVLKSAMADGHDCREAVGASIVISNASQVAYARLVCLV